MAKLSPRVIQLARGLWGDKKVVEDASVLASDRNAVTGALYTPQAAADQIEIIKAGIARLAETGPDNNWEALKRAGVSPDYVRQIKLSYSPENLAELERIAAIRTPFETGQPAIARVYHGSESGAIEAFDNARLGRNTGANSARLGHFLSGSPDTSNAYVGDVDSGDFESVLNRLSGAERKKVADEFYRSALATRYNVSYDDFSDLVTMRDPQALKWRDRFFSKAGVAMPPPPAPTSYPLLLNMENPLVRDWKGGDYRDMSYSAFLREAKGAGHDSAVLLNTYDGGPQDNIFVAFDPRNIRSVNARFDPAQRGSANILAGSAAAAVGLGALGQSEEADAMPLPSLYRRLLAQSPDRATLSGGPRILPGNEAPVLLPGEGYLRFGMNEDLARIAEEHAARQGERLPSRYVAGDPELGRLIANEYELAPASGDREARRAYAALARETSDQYAAAREAGFQHYLYPRDERGGIIDPYGNPRWAVDDVNTNRRLMTFPTVGGFGSDAGFISDSPLMQPSRFTDAAGNPLLINDEFRFIHDLYGHAVPGAGFRAGGEENAFRFHAPTFSPLARRAATAELRGQNSWLNYGPYGEFNRTASPADTHYADQKSSLLPRWVSEVGRESPRNARFEQLLASGRTGLEGAVDPRTGEVSLYHWAHQDLDRIDPAYQLTGLDRNNKAIRNRLSDPAAPKRAYFGLNVEGAPYQREPGLGDRRHVAKLPGAQLYDLDADPEGFRRLATGASEAERATALERLVADANYSGYVRRHPQLGATAAVFDPLAAQRGAVDPKLLGLTAAGLTAAGAAAPAEGSSWGMRDAVQSELERLAGEREAVAGGATEGLVPNFDPGRSSRLDQLLYSAGTGLQGVADENLALDLVSPTRPIGELLEKYATGEPRTGWDYLWANPLLYALPVR